MSENLTVRLGSKLALALEEEARQTGSSKGELVRQALEERLQRSQPLAVMKRYVGIMQGPADLSTNKNYRRVWKNKHP